jgi:T5SS/PEP-CTERM-associated repeat protein
MRSAYRPNPTWVLALCGSIVGGIASVAGADDFSWQAASNSNFSIPSSWTPAGGPPGAADRAIFDTGDQAGAVLFDTNPTNTQLVVRDDHAVFSLSGRTYTLTSFSPALPSVILGDAAQQQADLTLQAGGGTLQSVNSAIGWAAGTDALARLEGASWVASQGFTVGADGLGQIDILGGSSVQSQFAVLGSAAAGDGIVNVTENSQWTTAQQILIGGEGIGEFHVKTGALASAGSAVIANGASGLGLAEVIDAGSRWTIGQELWVGNNGDGRLNIFDGGHVTSNGASLAVAENSFGTVAISGEGAQWQNGGDLYVGGSALAAGGEGTLFIETGATVDIAGQTRIYPGGFVSLRGGTLRTTMIDNGGSIEYLFGTLHLTAADYIVGTAGLFGPALAITSGMDMIVDQQTTVDPDALLSITDGSYTTGTLSQQGRIALIVGALSVRDGGTNVAGAKIQAIDSTLNFPAASPFLNLGHFDLIDVTVNGSLNSPASATINIGGAVAFNGPVSGGASFVGSGTVTFNDVFEPGDGIGRVLFDGDVTLGTSSILRMELGGTIPGAEHDQLDVLGNVTLGGTLNVVLTAGFAPQDGDLFTLMVYDSSGGSFSAENYPPLDDGLLWDLRADGDTLTLAVRSDQTPGDMDGDGDVDKHDLRQFMTHFGTGPNATPSEGDFTNDGNTGLADLIILRNNLSGSAPSPVAVPEPGGAAILLAAIAAMVLLQASCRTTAGSGSKPARASAAK